MNAAPENIIVLTGAGISAESGVPVFRGADGLWEGHDWREIATPEAFEAQPELVHDFYNARRAMLGDVAPNAAHLALAELEAGWAARGGSLTVITQNIDDLHQRAGSKNLIPMHGELNKARCADCGAVADSPVSLSLSEACAVCGAAGRMRPHVVWFGEKPLRMEEIFERLSGADLFAAIGTSGAVYPAAGFVAEARQLGVQTLELNLEESEVSALFDETRTGKAGELAPQWRDELLNA